MGWLLLYAKQSPLQVTFLKLKRGVPEWALSPPGAVMLDSRHPRFLHDWYYDFEYGNHEAVTAGAEGEHLLVYSGVSLLGRLRACTDEAPQPWSEFV